ncbi:hypothetical protein BsIDN1_24910 [Bacillus safensis]|uniref:serine-type D-Ala-D-Ala carboxypeptidase n=1 Tax=Bacillus safensis TaxID=561879 RepID=A0A5S9M6X6_BACIA|nr:hypothetical protein BsIDN1_24910 [Bacillus safensis]
MYDARGRVVVDNESVPAIVYTSESGVKAEDKIKVARKLATYIKMDTDFLRERDIRDFFGWRVIRKKRINSFQKRRKKISMQRMSIRFK